MTDRVPAIGGARGVFEIFVPGLFLLLNFWAALYLLPATDEATRSYLRALVLRPALGAAIALPFGYLGGVILRLLRTEVPDRHSALFQRLFRAPGPKTERTLWAYEPFPYTRWLEYLVQHRLPRDAREFFSQFWSASGDNPEVADPRRRRQFVNFCKVVVSSADAGAAGEIYAAESLSRYISGMYYALCLGLFLLLTTAASRVLAGVPIGIGLVGLAVSYAIGILAILANFRFIRIKEVETIFAAAYKNRELFASKGAATICSSPSNPPMQPPADSLGEKGDHPGGRG